MLDFNTNQQFNNNFRTVAGIYAMMTYQKVAEKNPLHVDTCIERFAFAVNLIFSNKRRNIILSIARLTIPLLGLTISDL